MPPDFPLLLIVPAFAIDLLMQRDRPAASATGCSPPPSRRCFRRGLPRRAVAVRRLPDVAVGAQRSSSAAIAWTTACHPTIQERWYRLNPPTIWRRTADRGGARLRVEPLRTVVGQLDVASAAMSRVRRSAFAAGRWSSWRCAVDGARRQPRHVLRRQGRPVRRARQRAAAWRDSRTRAGHGPRRRRDRAGVDHHVTVRAGQWNVGLEGAPPPETAAAGAGRSDALRAGAVVHDALVVSARRRRRRTGRDRATSSSRSSRWRRRSGRCRRGLGGVLAALGVFLTVGFLTIVGSAVRESVLPPGVAAGREAALPRASRHRDHRHPRGADRCGAATPGGPPRHRATANRCCIGPFNAAAAVASRGDRRTLTLSIRDRRDGRHAEPAEPLQRAACRITAS